MRDEFPKPPEVAVLTKSNQYGARVFIQGVLRQGVCIGCVCPYQMGGNRQSIFQVPLFESESQSVQCQEINLESSNFCRIFVH